MHHSKRKWEHKGLARLARLLEVYIYSNTAKFSNVIKKGNLGITVEPLNFERIGTATNFFYYSEVSFIEKYKSIAEHAMV